MFPEFRSLANRTNNLDGSVGRWGFTGFTNHGLEHSAGNATTTGMGHLPKRGASNDRLSFPQVYRYNL